MFTWAESMNLHQLNEWSVLVRMVMATAFSGILGMERTHKRRAAGLRTYILVCLGATVIMMTGQFMAETVGGTDPARMGAQVVSGIGFLGAGTIMLTGVRQIKGLTTAAGLWAAACMGIALGIGFYYGAILMFVFVLLDMTVFDWIQRRFISRSHRMRVYVAFRTTEDFNAFLHTPSGAGACVEDFEKLDASADYGVGVMMMLQLNKRGNHFELLDMLKCQQGILFVEET